MACLLRLLTLGPESSLTTAHRPISYGNLRASALSVGPSDWKATVPGKSGLDDHDYGHPGGIEEPASFQPAGSKWQLLRLRELPLRI